MHYRIGEWIVDKNETTVRHIETGKTSKLEPIATELLTLLATNSGQLVTREELIEKIWNGRVITDHAIYRVITHLRKTLSPENKNEYIITVPKRGYKLIKPYQELDAKKTIEKFSSPEPGTSLVSHENSNLTLLVCLLLLGAVIFLFVSGRTDISISVLDDAVPLTSELGIESEPVFNHDASELFYLYTPRSETNNLLVRKNLASGSVVSLLSNSSIKKDLSISEDGQVLALTEFIGSDCQIRIYKLLNNQYSEYDSIQCSDEYTDIAINSDGSILYFTDTNASKSPHIFSYFIATGQTRQLTALDESNSLGEFVIALSPDDKKLAFVRYPDWETSIIGYIDVVTDQEFVLIETDGIMHSLAWDNENNLIYYPVNNKTISAFSLADKKTHTIANSITSNISSLRTSVKGDSLLISTDEIIRNSGIWQVQNPLIENSHLRQSELVIASSSLDLFPSFANLSNRIAFMSLRDGSPQIWIKEETGKEIKLTDFKDGRALLRMEWSPDDAYLLCDSNDAIFAIDVATGKIENLIETDSYGKVGGAIWSLDGEAIFFTSNISGDWQIHKKDLKSDQVKQITEKGGRAPFVSSSHPSKLFFIKAHKNGLWELDLSNNKYLETKLFSDINDEAYDGVAIHGDTIYYYSDEKKLKQFNFISKKTNALELDVMPDIPQFTISADQVNFLFSSNELVESSVIMLSASD